MVNKVLIDRAVVEQALLALNPTASGNWTPTIALNAESAIHALRAALEQQQVEQEPAIYPEEAFDMGLEAIPYYTHPQPPRQPLTDEWIRMIYDECDAETGDEFVFAFARDIERAHGITGEQE